ncbi:sterol methyltransferase [Ochromonadaceae sp. CCMP2298]|nr:sterol methyltransferase [Ochromonadaceae sp. CCMP2298]
MPTDYAGFAKADKQDQAIVVGVASVTIVASLALFNTLAGSNPIGRTLTIMTTFGSQEKKRNIAVNDWIDEYNDLHDGKLDTRNESYTTLVNAYYELATSFYEWGWGESFHFANQLPGETFKTAIARHEYYLAGRLGVAKGAKVLDCGCGIGGPMRNIAKFTNANITGVTLNEYQVMRGNSMNKAAGLTGSALSVQADFMKLEPFADNSFDGVYAIEATCHAPVREGVYEQIYRVLKPGQVFACYEWCLTPLYDANNEHHRLIKKKIEEGDGLPDMATQQECCDALTSVGFELIEARDMALDPTYGADPWWLPLHPSNNPFTFRFQLSPLGMWMTRSILSVCELVCLVPSGTVKVQTMLQQGGWGCAQGGFTGTFTPMWLMVARKPLK